jgi:23S rRNA pseudouridine2605 synthase
MKPHDEKDTHPASQRPETDEDGLIRLQKLLAQSGVASRRKCEELMLEGAVEVDGEVVTRLGTKVDPRTAVIRVEGRRLPPISAHVYLVLNKPRGVVSTMSDPEGRRSLGDLVADRPERLFHVGRLDTDTSGLLILTNDHRLGHRLTDPGHQVPKTYHARVRGVPGDEVLRALAEGVPLGDGTTSRPAAVRTLGSGREGGCWLEIVLTEGKNRQVRRMCAAVGHDVLELCRVAIGALTLDDLAPREWRTLDAASLAALEADPR